MARIEPFALALRAMSAPNSSSTRTPEASTGAPSAMARLNPSKITDLASAIRATSSGLGSPEIPNIFFWNDPRWSKARMKSFPSYPRPIDELLTRNPLTPISPSSLRVFASSVPSATPRSQCSEGGQEPGCAQGEPPGHAARIHAPHQLGRVRDPQSRQGRLRVEPDRRRVAVRIPNLPGSDDVDHARIDQGARREAPRRRALQELLR